MVYPYLRLPRLDDPSRRHNPRPILPIALVGEDKEIKLLALIDSGADDCIFPAACGEVIGLDIPKGRHGVGRGVKEEGGDFDIFFHDVEIKIEGFGEKRFPISIGLTYERGVPAILGQNPFFKFFRVAFDFSREEFELLAHEDYKRK